MCAYLNHCINHEEFRSTSHSFRRARSFVRRAPHRSIEPQTARTKPRTSAAAIGASVVADELRPTAVTTDVVFVATQAKGARFAVVRPQMSRSHRNPLLSHEQYLFSLICARQVHLHRPVGSSRGGSAQRLPLGAGAGSCALGCREAFGSCAWTDGARHDLDSFARIVGTCSCDAGTPSRHCVRSRVDRHRKQHFGLARVRGGRDLWFQRAVTT